MRRFSRILHQYCPLWEAMHEAKIWICVATWS